MSAQPQYLSARALASLGLVGLPSTQRSINRLRDRHGWQSVEAEGRILIDVASLPPAVRAEIEARFVPAPRLTPNPIDRRGAGRPVGTDFFTARPDVADAVQVILARQQLSATRVLDLITGQFDALPEIHTLRRFISKLEAQQRPLLESFRDPDLYKSRFRMAMGRADGGVTHANQIWELDSTKTDVMLKTGRRQVLGLIDVFSRRANFIIAPSESGQSVRRLLIDTIKSWGVMPEMVKTDNGSGFINASIVTALGSLDIEHHRVAPGSGDKKPHIERVFGTLTRERFELLPGYIGHSVGEAQKLRGRAKKETGRAVILPELDEGQLQIIINNWVEGVYNLRVHSGTGMSPLTRYQSSPALSVAAPSEQALLIALSALVGTQTVGKRGIMWQRGRYWSAALVPYIGRPVTVRRDEDDLGSLFIFDEDGRYIDTAVNFERAGLSEEAFAAVATAHQRAWMKEARADVRAKAKAFSPEKARADILRRDAEAAGKLVYLPLATRAAENSTLASIAADTAPLPLAPQRSIIIRHTADDQPQSAVAVAAKVDRAEALIAADDAGHTVDPERLAWAQAFVSGAAFKTFKATQAAALGGASIHSIANRRTS